MVCDLGTPENASKRIAGEDAGKCLSDVSDYLRLVSYGGLVDSMYCGTDKVSVVLGGRQPLALMFKTQKRTDQRQLGDLLNFVGFNCKLVCKGPDTNDSETTTTTTTSSTTITTTIRTTEDDVVKDVSGTTPDYIILPQGVTKAPGTTTTTAETTLTTSTTTTTTPTTPTEFLPEMR
jgi:hypothetical protein